MIIIVYLEKQNHRKKVLNWMLITARTIYVIVIFVCAWLNFIFYIKDSNPKLDYKFYSKYFVSFIFKFVQYQARLRKISSQHYNNPILLIPFCSFAWDIWANIAVVCSIKEQPIKKNRTTLFGLSGRTRVDMHLNLSQNNYQVANPTSTAFSSTAFRDLSQKFSSLNTSRNAEPSPAQVSNFLH